MDSIDMKNFLIAAILFFAANVIGAGLTVSTTNGYSIGQTLDNPIVRGGNVVTTNALFSRYTAWVNSSAFGDGVVGDITHPFTNAYLAVKAVSTLGGGVVICENQTNTLWNALNFTNIYFKAKGSTFIAASNFTNSPSGAYQLVFNGYCVVDGGIYTIPNVYGAGVGLANYDDDVNLIANHHTILNGVTFINQNTNNGSSNFNFGGRDGGTNNFECYNSHFYTRIGNHFGGGDGNCHYIFRGCDFKTDTVFTNTMLATAFLGQFDIYDSTFTCTNQNIGNVIGLAITASSTFAQTWFRLHNVDLYLTGASILPTTSFDNVNYPVQYDNFRVNGKSYKNDLPDITGFQFVSQDASNIVVRCVLPSGLEGIYHQVFTNNAPPVVAYYLQVGGTNDFSFNGTSWSWEDSTNQDHVWAYNGNSELDNFIAAEATFPLGSIVYVRWASKTNFIFNFLNQPSNGNKMIFTNVGGTPEFYWGN